MSRRSPLRRVSAVALLALPVLVGTITREAPAEGPSRGEAAYLVVHEVLVSPRCRNCHPVGDAPLHGDQGVPHSMNVTRASPPAGLPCTTCHRAANGTSLGSPPGVPGWRMPSREMPLVFQGKSPHELCEQLKDPARNGGRSGEALVEHMGHDPLVLWGWSPGPGRSTPRVPHEVFAKAAETWVHEGMPCPP
jgi:hypothetical protein